MKSNHDQIIEKYCKENGFVKQGFFSFVRCAFVLKHLSEKQKAEDSTAFVKDGLCKIYQKAKAKNDAYQIIKRELNRLESTLGEAPRYKNDDEYSMPYEEYNPSYPYPGNPWFHKDYPIKRVPDCWRFDQDCTIVVMEVSCSNPKNLDDLEAYAILDEVLFGPDFYEGGGAKVRLELVEHVAQGNHVMRHDLNLIFDNFELTTIMDQLRKPIPSRRDMLNRYYSEISSDPQPDFFAVF